ncbi:unnamed protein product [Sphagnum jensenii]|jgi:hypothetical protein|uniref:Uncharacterized protein n=1 Tax=Sphagnum jensenii TaxID=128206 RepID=A0ABP0XKL5_9BRYO
MYHIVRVLNHLVCDLEIHTRSFDAGLHDQESPSMGRALAADQSCRFGRPVTSGFVSSRRRISNSHSTLTTCMPSISGLPGESSRDNRKKHFLVNPDYSALSFFLAAVPINLQTEIGTFFKTQMFISPVYSDLADKQYQLVKLPSPLGNRSRQKPELRTPGGDWV